MGWLGRVRGVCGEDSGLARIRERESGSGSRDVYPVRLYAVRLTPDQTEYHLVAYQRGQVAPQQLRPDLEERVGRVHLLETGVSLEQRLPRNMYSQSTDRSLLGRWSWRQWLRRDRAQRISPVISQRGVATPSILTHLFCRFVLVGIINLLERSDLFPSVAEK